MGPADQVAGGVVDQKVIHGQGVLTADEKSDPLSVVFQDQLLLKCKTECGNYKDVQFKFKGVEGLRRWLFSVPGVVRASSRKVEYYTVLF